MDNEYLHVNDTNVIWPHGREELDKSVGHLNGQSEHIQFTMEIEENGSIPFFDAMATKKQDRTLTLPTQQYLHADSDHHPAQKMGVHVTRPYQDVYAIDNR
jgi:hypothetical protein